MALACGHPCFYWPRHITASATQGEVRGRLHILMGRDTKSHFKRCADREGSKIRVIPPPSPSFPKVLFLKPNCPKSCKVFAGVLYFSHSLSVFPAGSTPIFSQIPPQIIFFTPTTPSTGSVLLFLKKRFSPFYYDYQQKPSPFHGCPFQAAHNTL